MTRKPKALVWKLTNLKEFLRTLEKTGRAVTGLQLLKSLRAGENFAIGEVKINIREWELIESGNLLGSVQEQRSMVLGNKATVWFGPQTVYAAIHEFGGTIHSTSGNGLVFQIEGQWIRTMSVNIPARPYLRPGIDENLDQIVETIKENLWMEVEAAYNHG